jgi:hypothetical protein
MAATVSLLPPFVATDDDVCVIGFYSLSWFTLAIGDLPEEIGSKLPRYDAIPATLIGPTGAGYPGARPRYRRASAGRRRAAYPGGQSIGCGIRDRR